VTFTEIVTEVAAHLGLTSSEATTRIGRLVNMRHREVAAALGLATSKRAAATKVVTIANATVVFTAEKLLNVYTLPSGSQPNMLIEVPYDVLIAELAQSGDTPTRYAVLSSTSTTVTIVLDYKPATAYTLYADAMVSTSTLSGSNEPAWPAPFHDILFYGVVETELRKQEKKPEADEAKSQFNARLSNLRMWAAKAIYEQGQQYKPRYLRS
jgi:hypothetical protein